MLAGVWSISNIGRTTNGETISRAIATIAVSVTHPPIVDDNSSLSFAPKYWATIILTPTEIPINSTISKFKIGLALPTAARALSPT